MESKVQEVKKYVETLKEENEKLREQLASKEAKVQKEEESYDEDEEDTMAEQVNYEESFNKVAALIENVYKRLESVEAKLAEAQTGNPYDQSDEEQADNVDKDGHPVAHEDKANKDGDVDKITKNESTKSESTDEDEEESNEESLSEEEEETESEAAQGEEVVEDDAEVTEEEPMSEDSDEEESEVEEPVMAEKVTSVANIFAEKSGRGDKALLGALKNK